MPAPIVQSLAQTLAVDDLQLAAELVDAGDAQEQGPVLVHVPALHDQQVLRQLAYPEVREVARGDGQGGYFEVPRAWVVADAAAGVPHAG